jgi:pyrroline-5-carboxylate reductase
MKIVILGYGNMGSAIADRLKNKYQIYAFDKDRSKLAGAQGISVVNSLEELANASKIMVLAIKPQDFGSILAELKKFNVIHLIISIAAGITTAHIESVLDKKAVIRVMPNLPAKAGEGMICLSRGKYATETDLLFARSLFNNMGKTLIVEERMMDGVTAVSGSGPGFLYALLGRIEEAGWDDFVLNEFIPKLADAARLAGFTEEQAQLLAQTTAHGSMVLLREAKVSPEALKTRVSSKGGTTEAGLAVLAGNVENLASAVRTAMKRSRELSVK